MSAHSVPEGSALVGRTAAREKGLALFREVYGDALADGMIGFVESGTGFGVDQARWTLDWAFGELWTREGLDRKLRSCVVLGMLIAGGHQGEIRFHTKMGIANGLTRAELEEIFLTAIPYCGFPSSNVAKAAMLQALAELDAEDGAGG